MKLTEQLMTTGEVAKLLGISDERVRQLDDELRPHRTVTGRRIYDPKRVAIVAKKRGVEVE